jgi:hypothetical protein
VRHPAFAGFALLQDCAVAHTGWSQAAGVCFAQWTYACTASHNRSIRWIFCSRRRPSRCFSNAPRRFQAHVCLPFIHQEKKQKKKRKAEEAAGQKAAADDWNRDANAWRPFDRERDLGHAPKAATPAEVRPSQQAACGPSIPRCYGYGVASAGTLCLMPTAQCSQCKVLKKAGSLANRFGGGGSAAGGGRTFL